MSFEYAKSILSFCKKKNWPLKEKKSCKLFAWSYRELDYSLTTYAMNIAGTQNMMFWYCVCTCAHCEVQKHFQLETEVTNLSQFSCIRDTNLRNFRSIFCALYASTKLISIIVNGLLQNQVESHQWMHVLNRIPLIDDEPVSHKNKLHLYKTCD